MNPWIHGHLLISIVVSGGKLRAYLRMSFTASLGTICSWKV